MPRPLPGSIDCDVHPAVPDVAALRPYLDEHWSEMVVQRSVYDLESFNYPLNSPLSARPDWRFERGKPGQSLEKMSRDLLDPFSSAVAICNCLYGVQVLFSEDLAAAMCRAINDWMVKEWLDRDPRLRASIVVPLQNVEMAVAEIERCAADRRFVQVLFLAMGEQLLGRRQFWPIYAAAERHGLAIGIHAGSAYRYPLTAAGGTSYYTQDYVAQAQAFQSQLTSLICEGVFSKYPALRVVMIESGFSWLPSHLTRLSKFWRGLRMEVPWVDRSPFEIVRSNVRFTLQPFDAPPDPDIMMRLIDQTGSDALLLYSSDYPHWQYDGEDALPEGLGADLIEKICIENPRNAYPRLAELAR